MQLLRNHTLARICTQPRARQVEQPRVVEPFGRRSHDVPDPDIHLDGQARSADTRLNGRPPAAVIILGTDRLDADRIREELHRVGLHFLRRDLTQDARQGLLSEVPVAQEVGVAGGPQTLAQPDEHHQRALQHEAIGVGRTREPVEEALNGVTRKDEVRIDTDLARVPGESDLNRPGQALTGSAHRVSASR